MAPTVEKARVHFEPTSSLRRVHVVRTDGSYVVTPPKKASREPGTMSERARGDEDKEMLWTKKKAFLISVSPWRPTDKPRGAPSDSALAVDRRLGPSLPRLRGVLGRIAALVVPRSAAGPRIWSTRWSWKDGRDDVIFHSLSPAAIPVPRRTRGPLSETIISPLLSLFMDEFTSLHHTLLTLLPPWSLCDFTSHRVHWTWLGLMPPAWWAGLLSS